MARKAALAALAVLLTGCINHRNWFEPPIPRETDSVDAYKRLGAYLHANSPEAQRHFVRDVGSTVHGGVWRWTGQRPTFRFYLPDTQKWRLHMDFTIPPQTFQSTGPVTVRLSVNGMLVGEVSCPKDGYYRFEQPVPPGALRPEIPAVVTAEIDKTWTPKPGEAPLGFILTRVGFLR